MPNLVLQNFVMSPSTHRLREQAISLREEWDILYRKACTKPELMHQNQIERRSDISAFAAEAIVQHETTLDLQKSLLDAIAELNDEQIWDDCDFDGHTEHTLRTAGLALALSEALSMAFEAEVTERLENDAIVK